MAMSNLSCASTKFCLGIDGTKLIQTTDGGVTWRVWTPGAWATASAVPNIEALDCVSAANCWLAGFTAAPGGVAAPYLAQLRNGRVLAVGSLPRNSAGQPYAFTGISCPSAMSCTAVADTEAKSAISVMTSNGGLSWRLARMISNGSATGVSCVRPGSGSSSGTPSIMVSHNGGQTWTSALTATGADWNLGSISCADANHCWATTDSFTDVVLLGTADGGTSWTQVTSGAADGEYSSQVSYLNASTWVTSADARIFVTTDDGGLAG
jgi:hypothetical protein